LPDIQLFSSAPNSCAQSASAQPAPESANCKCAIVERCSRTISNQTQITNANQALLDSQTLLLTSIDNQTGSMLGRHFSLLMIVLSTPTVRDDYSMDLTVLVNFVSRERIYIASKDHQRVFCPCVKRFVSKLANFDENITQNADCNWKAYLSNSNTTNSPPVISGKSKRGVLQQAATLSPFAGGNTYTATLTFPGDAVQRLFGTSAPQAPGNAPANSPANSPGMVPAPLSPLAPGTGVQTPNQPSMVNSTTGSEPVGGSGSVSRALLLWIISAAAAMLIFGF
jgi:hypothetical protein